MRELLSHMTSKELREALNTLYLAEIVFVHFTDKQWLVIYYDENQENGSFIIEEMKRYSGL